MFETDMGINRHRLYWATRDMVHGYVTRTMDARVQPFLDRHLRSFKGVSKRSLRYALPDLAIGLYNLPAWGAGKLARRKWTIQPLAARRLQKCFIDEVFLPEEFEQRYRRLVERNLFAPFREDLNRIRAELQREGLWDAEAFEHQVRLQLERVGSTGRAMSQAVLMAIEIGVGSLVYGEVCRGFGAAIGAATAEKIYLGTVPFYSALWAGVFGLPVWVETIGMIAGGAFALAVLAPLIGAAVETVVNRRKDLRKAMRQGYPNLIAGLLEERDPGTGRTRGTWPQVVDTADTLTDALDFIRDAARLLATSAR